VIGPIAKALGNFGREQFIEGCGKEVWVTELQAEPWEPGHLAYREEKVPPTGDPEETEKFFMELKEIGIKTIFLWGVEYWRFREWKYKDTKWKKLLCKFIKEKETER